MRRFSILLAVSLFLNIFTGLGDMPAAAASSQATQDVALTFPNSSKIGSKLYSKQTSLASSAASVAAPSGSKIQKVELYYGGSVKQTLINGAALSSWSGSVTLYGQERGVISKNNESAKGYFAWYRYAKGSKPGDKWFYGGYAGQCPSPSSSANLDAFGMPATPGCTEAGLTLKGTVLPYYLGDSDGVVIPNSAIVDTVGALSAVAKVNDAVEVPGPEGLSAKPYNRTTLTGVTMDSPTSFTVSFKQDFSSLGEVKDLASYGARLNVYFSAWKVDVTSKTYEYDANAKLIVTFVGDVPPTITIDGDFDISPSSTINWRDSFTLTPKDFNISANCTYQYHEFKISRNGSSWGSEKLYGQTTSKSFSYSSYPFVMGVGSHNISIKITTTCGDSGWIKDKTLTVNGPESNNPPNFSVGWTTPGEWSQTGVKNSVVVGSYLDLVYLDNPAPNDPDGDDYRFLGFDFTNQAAWTRDIPSKYGAYMNGYHQILMDTPGYYCATGTMRDSFGATSTQHACIDVTEPNPVPVITAPDVIKENHPVTPAINGDLSYSPVGRSIDHSKDIWTNRKSIYTTPGTQTITLDVFDSAELKSLTPAAKTINVQPDQPPVALLDVQPLGIRGGTYDVFNNSYSPDGDKIVSAAYRYRYDKANNGFGDDAWVSLAGTLTKSTLSPTKVGKYEIEVTVTEDYGKSAVASVILDTVNQAPSVSFLVEGENDIPQPDNKKLYAPQDILSSWSLYETNSTKAIQAKGASWYENGAALSAGLGKLPGRPKTYYESYERYSTPNYRTWVDPMQDLGYGANTLNGYRAIANSSVATSQPLLVPRTPGARDSWKAMTFSASTGFFLRTSPTHIYYAGNVTSSTDGVTLLAMNKSKIGGYQGSAYYCQGCTYPSYWDHQFTDGDPFDFILEPKSLASSKPDIKYGRYSSVQDYYARKFSYSTTRAAPQWKVVAVEVSDRTVYQIIEWRCENCSYYYSSTGDDEYVDEILIDLRTYDAVTGELIQSTALSGVDLFRIFDRNVGSQAYYYTRGDTLIYIDPYTGKVTEFDRNGNVLIEKKAFLPQYTNPSSLYRGPDGEWYRYSVEGESPTSTYVYKYKPDYTIAWKVKLKGSKPTFEGSLSWALGDPTDAKQILLINPIKREVIARSDSINGFGYDEYYQKINMDTGAITDFDTTNLKFTSHNSSMGVDWNGYYVSASGTDRLTPDGYNTVLDRGNNRAIVYNSTGQSVASFRSGGVLDIAGITATSTKDLVGGIYVGDGIYLFLYTTIMFGYEQYGTISPWIVKGTPTNNSLPYQPIKLGQFASTESIDNSEIIWTMKMAQPKSDANMAGMSFRMTDPRNRYAIETNGTTLYLSKYVNGARTILQQIAFSFQAGVDYNFKLSMQGTRIQVFVNGVPYMDKSDTKFSSGKFGPFTDKVNVDFSNMIRLQLSNPSTQWLTNFAIWDSGTAVADVRYSNIVFDDPENDPLAGNYQWSVQHTPKFLNNQGTSTLNGQTLTSPALHFDKVGNYRITLKAQDDPQPGYLFPSPIFADYRKWSNEYWQIITVHRRPVAQFSLSINPADKTVIWNDQSYDPDRWQSAAVYSTEATGINYKTTRGILERKYYYITPSGLKKEGKLVTPQETGTYLAGLQVKDEFGAWSYLAEQTIAIATPVAPDEPPTPGFTLSKTTLHRGDMLTITSTAKDKEDGAAASLKHEYFVRNVTEGSAESLLSTSRGKWTHNLDALGVVEIRQVVCDSKGQCAQITKSVSVTNLAPHAQFDWLPKPAYEGDNITITNQSTDPDADILTYAWTITGPSGYKRTGTSKNITLPGSATADRSGIYHVVLTVLDPSHAAHSNARDLTVNKLGIQGAVQHTANWENNRLRYNEKYPTSARPSDWFWAGEAFVLQAATTDTGSSATKPIFVEVSAPHDLYKQLEATIAGSVHWEGLLRSQDAGFSLSRLPQGPLTFTFTVTYSNGVVKTAQVAVVLQDTIDSFVQVHRLQ